MTARERFVRCLTGQKVDRPPYCLIWGPWGSAWERWKSEGMPFKDWWELREHFGAEPAPSLVGVLYGPAPNLGWRTIEETETSYTFKDNWDIVRRNLKTNESMSEFLSYPVKDRESWEKFKAERLQIDHPDRFKGDWLKQCKEWMTKGMPIQLGTFPDVTLFGGTRWMMGDEECLVSFYTMPDVIKDMMDHLTNIYLYVFDRVLSEGVEVDVIHIWEDMSGKQGSLISPAHVREFMKPNYLRIKKFAKDHNIPLMSVDTDGNCDDITPALMEGGMNYLWPMEVAAGADVNLFRKKYPDLALMGGFDKRAAAIGPKAIDAEFERIRPAVESGRYIPDFDHLIPNDVSWENFVYYAEGLKKLVGKK